jgi:hypothetical protein
MLEDEYYNGYYNVSCAECGKPIRSNKEWVEHILVYPSHERQDAVIPTPPSDDEHIRKIATEIANGFAEIVRQVIREEMRKNKE